MTLLEKTLDTLSASALRKLLIDEVKLFIECLDNSSHEELLIKRTRIIEIYKAVTLKEQLDMLPLVWGRNAANTTIDEDQG